MERAAGGPGQRPWQPTRALRRAAGVVVVLLLVAVVFGRADLVAVAVPLVLGTVLALARRPVAPPTIGLRVGTDVVAEGQPVLATMTVRADTTLDLVTAQLSTSDWLGIVAGRTVRSSAVRAGEQVEFDVRIRPMRWGRHRVGPVVLAASACDGLLECHPQVALARLLSALPIEPPFAATDVVPRAAGMVGSHRSRRPGDGGELSGIRQFAAGDRLRRIDWRVSLRTREMHVNATLSERDTDVVVLLDLLHDAGRSGGVDGAASSLDTTVRAAATLAEHYLSVGDRVGVVGYGARLRFIPPTGGRTQLRRITEFLLDCGTRPEGSPASGQLLGPRVLPQRALTIVLTPLVDEQTTEIVAAMAQRGQSVIAVDTLPADARPDNLDALSQLAWRLWWMQRDGTVHRLREVGVPVVRWQGAGSLDGVLRDVSRMASAGRAR